MDPDKYQQAWQAHSSQTRVTIDVDLLRKEVQREEQNFRAMIFWRDFREVVVALLMIPMWFYLGITTSSPWTWYLTVPVLVWIAGFMLVDRLRHKQKPSEPGESLLQCVEESLPQVEHQIWLLRNIFWWYLLPPSVSIMAFFAHTFWMVSSVWWEFLFAILVSGLGLFVLYAAIYFLNQRAVREQLEPRRQELLTLLASLQDETANDHVTLSALPFAESRLQTPCISPASPARLAIAMFSLVVIMLLVVVIVKVINNTAPYTQTGEVYPKKSPFAAVRWQEAQPEVQLGEQWFKLVSLDEIPASEIVAFSQQTYESLWRKRFEEDLVELLTRMGHPPQDKVTLVVQSLTSSETWVRENVPMTEENRSAIYEANQKQETTEP
ncbi:MAG: hypothetical protein K0U86_19280 [Planctomycetes bacterium]|nr:hypothetical protein [Planctomycetota bacterium]MCH9727050.1 hypothetical protein [Planctomycetota bacterium]MCH9774993.1 hypothetical protein [Planctomycetota bacterium]MCH9789236.1 hypothetical protein [Planctomycetota bacterium]